MDYQQLKALIDRDIASKQDRYVGRDLYYYKYEGSEEKVINVGGNIKIIKPKSSIYINYMKQLVTQKIDYILAEEVTVDNSIYALIPDINDLLDKMLLNSSIDSRSWLYFYIDDRKKLQWTIVLDSQIIPIYDKYDKYIETLIRYYLKDKNIMIVEIWNSQAVEIIEMDYNTESLNSTIKPHYTLLHEYDNQIEAIEPMSFGFIPFIQLFNNKDKTSDAEDIEDLIKCYNSITSGLVDNIDLFQEALVKLKGFTGNSDDLKEAMNQMKITKAVAIPSDGEMEYLKVEIPVEARQMILQLLKDSIYTIGRGMDSTRLGDGNITNVVIKSRYQQLHFKSADCIKRLNTFYIELIDKLNYFYNTAVPYDLKFNRSMLVNEQELIDSCVKSVGLVSKETILENHPWVRDVKLELDRLKLEDIEEDKEEIKQPSSTDEG